MSRIGNMPIELPTGVTLNVDTHKVTVTGPKGNLMFEMPRGVSLSTEMQLVSVSVKGKDTSSRALHGLVRATVSNMVTGVTKGWSKSLELSGVGYRASTSGEDLVLTVGYSHQVTIKPPSGISFVIAEGKIVVNGVDKQAVGQIAAKIRDVKKPEPYKGKGIKYAGEHIRKKAGKTAKAVGATK